MTTHTAYVAGLMFDTHLQQVALIRKNKPAWQAWKLNGIGGKIEESDRSPVAAMTREFREFQEETGICTWDDWRLYCLMKGSDFSVSFFCTFGHLPALRTMESEPIEIVPVDSILPHRPDIVDNLPWLVSLAINHLQTGRPSFVTVEYP